jgi:hypothetical protein
MNLHGRICAMMIKSSKVEIENGDLAPTFDEQQYLTDRTLIQENI